MHILGFDQKATVGELKDFIRSLLAAKDAERISDCKEAFAEGKVIGAREALEGVRKEWLYTTESLILILDQALDQLKD